MRTTRIKSEMTPRKHRLAKPFSRLRRALGRLKRSDGWHWFDHPEMRARIEKAEEDRREGRVRRFDSREAALDWLDGLA